MKRNFSQEVVSVSRSHTVPNQDDGMPYTHPSKLYSVSPPANHKLIVPPDMRL